MMYKPDLFKARNTLVISTKLRKFPFIGKGTVLMPNIKNSSKGCTGGEFVHGL
jgi:hypothetical protein